MDLRGSKNYPGNRQYLSNSFLNRRFGDKTVDHDLFVLTDSVSSAEGLQTERPKHC